MKGNGDRAIIQKCRDSAKLADSKRSQDLMARIQAQHDQMLSSARQAQDAHLDAIRAKNQKEEQFRAQLIEDQKKMIELQRQLLAEARRDKWKTAFWVGIACVVVSVILQMLFGLL